MNEMGSVARLSFAAANAAVHAASPNSRRHLPIIVLACLGETPAFVINSTPLSQSSLMGSATRWAGAAAAAEDSLESSESFFL